MIFWSLSQIVISKFFVMDKFLTLRPEDIATRIFFIRGERVMLDFDLATLYQVETRVLKQQIRRNLDRFPDDFMFQLTKTEWQKLVTNCDNLGPLKFTPSTPFAFTEQGVAMLSSILKSKKAIEVNIAIMRTFVHLRKILNTNKELAKKIDALEMKYDEQFQIIFDAIRRLIRQENKPRRRIGFETEKDLRE